VFALFMVLVTVPSLAISGFGVLAIVDARAVAEARLKQSWAQRLRLLAADAAIQLRGLEGELHAPTAETDPAEARAILARNAQAQATALEALLPELAKEHFPADLAMVVLVHDPLAETPRATAERYRQTLDAWMEGRAAVADLLRQDVITELRLPPPLDEYRLEARLRGDDLLATQVRTRAVLYAVLLTLFYVVLILGVVLVSVSMYRQVQLSRLRTDFVSHVSHELRTPLTSIRMFLETVLKGRVQSREEELECLRTCARETERLSQMIERVLDWARLEAGKKTWVPIATTAGEIVERALDAFAVHAQDAPYHLERHLETPDAPLLVDRDAVTDALLNLLHNAYKYTLEDKRIDVAVRTHGRHVELSVTDNGVGIRRQDLKRVFDRFYRAEDLMSSRPHGSGLGLALAKRMVEGQGGVIKVQSRPGAGSTFTICLPLDLSPRVSPTTPRHPDPTVTAATP
jgi:two-component system phosphate regulon sensor histidine kinase PhoR